MSMQIKKCNKVYEYKSSTPSPTWANKIKRLEERQGEKVIIRKVELADRREYRIFVLKR